MVATEARKARRLAAALAATGKADATVHVKPTPAPPQAAPIARDAPTSNRPSSHTSSGGDRKKTFVGVGSKAAGNYTPPAILRAVANAQRNKETKGGGGGGSGGDGLSVDDKNADWLCKCGTSNFAKRRECFKCRLPKPGRTFSAAGVKGYAKRQQRREEKRKEKEGGKEEGEDTKQKQKEQTTEKKEVPVKRKFSDGEGEGEASAKRVANSEPKDSNDATPSKRKSVKPSDKGKAPKKLRDPDSVLVYLEGWATAVNEREEKGIASDAPGFKPSNGWKLDKNIQNWLLHNVFVPNEVDDDVFGMTVLYVGGWRGGPLERTRERAREMNVGKGVVPERARAVLRALHTGD